MNREELVKKIRENQDLIQQEFNKLFDLGIEKKETKEYKDIDHQIRLFCMHGDDMEQQLKDLDEDKA